jgi:hypothetical protein
MSGAALAETRRVMGPYKQHLNRRKTIAKYYERLRTLPRQVFASLHGVFLTSYDLHSTIWPEDQLSDILVLDCPAVTLMRYARSIGIDVKGITSERRGGGQHLEATRSNPDHKFVFVGKTQASGKRKLPVFCMQPEDQVFYAEHEQTSVDVFHEHI